MIVAYVLDPSDFYLLILDTFYHMLIKIDIEYYNMRTDKKNFI